MKHQQKTWLVAYDICAPRRLRRVHRLLQKEGIPAQYSAFTVAADDTHIQHLMATLAGLIDRRVDDLRAYHLPSSCPVWSLGTQQWPDGILLSGSLAGRLLAGIECAAEYDAIDPVKVEAGAST